MPSAVDETARGPIRSLRSGIAWASVGNAVYVACQYGMLVVIAKLGNREAVGQFALALGISAPIIVMTQMQLRQLQVTDSRGTTAFADYFRHRLVWTGLAAALLAVAAIGYGGETGLIIGAVGAAKAFESLSDVVHGHLQRHERMDLVSASMVIRGLGSVVVLTAVMWLTGSLATATVCMALVWAALFFGFDMPLRNRAGGVQALTPGNGMAGSRSLTRLAAPLAVGSTLISVSANLPRYFLDALYGKEAVALFSIAAAPLALGSVLLGSLMQASLPRAAACYQSGDRDGFRRIALWLTGANVMFGLACALGFWLIGKPLMTLLFTAEYAEAVPSMIIMSLGLALGAIGTYGAIVLSSARRFMLQLANVVVMVALQLGVCWVLISAGGVQGAAWAELLRYAGSACFLLLVGAAVARKAGSASAPGVFTPTSAPKVAT